MKISNISFSGRLGKLKGECPPRKSFHTTVYLSVEGFPTEEYDGGIRDCIRRSRFFHKHSYLDEVKRFYDDRPNYYMSKDPADKFNTVYFLDPDEVITDKEREKYDFIVHDYLPVVPFLPNLKSLYYKETDSKNNNFDDLIERSNYFHRLQMAEEQNLKDLKVQYILKSMSERPTILSKMEEIRNKIKNAQQEQANAMHAYFIYGRAKRLIDRKLQLEASGSVEELKENDAKFNKAYKELEKFYQQVYTQKEEE